MMMETFNIFFISFNYLLYGLIFHYDHINFSNVVWNSIMHLNKKMVDSKETGQFVFVNLTLVSNVGIREPSKENR